MKKQKEMSAYGFLELESEKKKKKEWKERECTVSSSMELKSRKEYSFLEQGTKIWKEEEEMKWEFLLASSRFPT